MMCLSWRMANLLCSMICNEELMDELGSKWDPGRTLTLEVLDALVEAQKEKLKMLVNKGEDEG